MVGFFFFKYQCIKKFRKSKQAKKKKKNRNTAIKKRTSWLAKKGNDFK